MGIKFTHQCKGTQNNHEKNHICQIVANRDMGRVKELVKDSKFFCKNCGRTAHIAGRLCNPTKI
jgi:hypothetical protein